jgi:hypothetical protein
MAILAILLKNKLATGCISQSEGVAPGSHFPEAGANGFQAVSLRRPPQ